MIRGRWRSGNRIELLEGGEEYFPRVFDAIRQARTEVLVETFILFDDPVGRQLQDVLVDAAKRGLRVALTADAFGSPDLSDDFVGRLSDAGAQVHLFDPQPKLLGVATNLFRRLHRKLVAIDGQTAFVGGINYSHDHLVEYGPGAKLDYAVQVWGPVVQDIRLHMNRLFDLQRRRRFSRWLHRPVAPPPTWPIAAEGPATAMLVTRDNRLHRDDIERHYRTAIARARTEIIIASAYFFPGYRLLSALREAARRGVGVHLILQGAPDHPSAQFAATTLYDYLMEAGIHIHEYGARPMHSKVAVIDGNWATIGSSNLDPPSLFLNLEANLVVRNAAFAETLRARLQAIMADPACVEVEHRNVRSRGAARQALDIAAFEFLKWMPTIARYLRADPGAAIRWARNRGPGETRFSRLRF